MFNKRWPLWLQITSAMAGVSLVVALAAGEMMRAIETDYLRDELRRESLRTSQAITIALTDTVASGQFEELEALVAQMHREDAFIYSLALQDPRGTTVSRWVGAQEAPPGSVFYFSIPSDIPGHGSGKLVVSWNVAGLVSSIEAHVAKLRLNMIVTVALLGALLVALVHFLVMRPMGVLGRGLDNLAHGEPDATLVLPTLAASEMDRLARSVDDLGRYQHELKRTQHSLEHARREAETASEAKGRFLAVMSHEIRTPLNGVIGSLELLGDAQLDARDKGLLSNAQRSVDSLLEIINEILDFSRIEAGGVELEDVEFQLEAQMNDVATSVATLVDHDKVELVVDFDPALPGRVRGDPLRLRQIVTNLLGNAIKFTREGCVVLSLARLDARRMRVEVSDTGIGISAAQQENLFSPFAQADSSTSRRFGGTGLGLSICKQLVELMGGRIGVESWPGQGSTFWFEVPLSQVNSPRRFDEYGLHGHRALVVESDPFVRKAVEGYLSSFDLTVASVEDVQQARGWLEGRAWPIDYVVVGSRIESDAHARNVRALREFSGNPQVRLIAMLPPGRSVVENTVDSFVLKPVRRNDLARALADDPGGETVDDFATDIEAHPQPSDARVLVVDDNAMNLQVASAMLERLGLEVHTASSGPDALELMDRLRFQVILMDEQMPEMDGLETTRRIRARDCDDADTPVVALTANADKAAEQRCLEAGMNAFLAKPVRRKAIRTMLSRWLPAMLDTPEAASH